jgi:hypothetical protein
MSGGGPDRHIGSFQPVGENREPLTRHFHKAC